MIQLNWNSGKTVKLPKKLRENDSCGLSKWWRNSESCTRLADRTEIFAFEWTEVNLELHGKNFNVLYLTPVTHILRESVLANLTLSKAKLFWHFWRMILHDFTWLKNSRRHADFYVKSVSNLVNKMEFAQDLLYRFIHFRLNQLSKDWLL